MKNTLTAVTAAMLFATSAVGIAQNPPARPAKVRHHAAAVRRPSIESQIDLLRQQIETQGGQIEALQQQLTERNAQLQQAQQKADLSEQQAQQAAQAAQLAAGQEQQGLAANAMAVASLQSSVSNLQATTASSVASVQKSQTEMQKAIENPDAIHYKGVTISPKGSFVELAAVNRTRATGSDVTTAFSSIPLENSDAGQMSEFFMSGRQSRFALDAIGKFGRTTFHGYYEMDWLGTGVTSNNNQSDGYVLRDRQLWAQVETRNGWIVTGGQMWALATAYTQGLTNKLEAIPMTIDANYHVGFIYTRQPSFRVVKNIGDRLWLAASLEQAQTLSPSCSGENFAGTASIDCPSNYVVGATGTGSGNYNGGGAAGTSAPLTGYTYNLAPDVISKIAFEPGYGHYEVFGMARFFRDRVYPAGNSIGAWNDTELGGGVGASARFSIRGIDIGAEGLYGDGAARYGASQLPDVTVRPDGQLSLIHNVSGMAFVEGHATHRIDIYSYYGEDYDGRDFIATSAGEIGYGLYTSNDSGCNAQAAPGTTDGDGYSPGSTGTCQSSTKDVQEGTFGYWYDLYSGAHGRLRQGLQFSYLQRYLWSGLGGVGIHTNDGMVETSFRYYLP